MILHDILAQLTRIADAQEKIAGIEKQQVPSNFVDSKAEILSEDNSKEEETELERQLEAGRKEGFMFEEDVVPLELLNK